MHHLPANSIEMARFIYMPSFMFDRHQKTQKSQHDKPMTTVHDVRNTGHFIFSALLKVYPALLYITDKSSGYMLIPFVYHS